MIHATLANGQTMLFYLHETNSKIVRVIRVPDNFKLPITRKTEKSCW